MTLGLSSDAQPRGAIQGVGPFSVSPTAGMTLGGLSRILGLLVEP